MPKCIYEMEPCAQTLRGRKFVFEFYYIFIKSLYAPSKLRWLNCLRPEINLESDSNHLFMDFFDPNMLSESESSWRNWFQGLRNPSKSWNSIKRIKNILKVIEFDWIWSKKSIYINFFNLIDYIRHFWSSNWLFLIF